MTTQWHSSLKKKMEGWLIGSFILSLFWAFFVCFIPVFIVCLTENVLNYWKGNVCWWWRPLCNSPIIKILQWTYKPFKNKKKKKEWFSVSLNLFFSFFLYYFFFYSISNLIKITEQIKLNWSESVRATSSAHVVAQVELKLIKEQLDWFWITGFTSSTKVKRKVLTFCSKTSKLQIYIYFF